MSGSPFGIGEFLSSEDASSRTEDTANRSIDNQWRMYTTTREDQMPLITAGQKAINQLSAMTQPGGSLYDTKKYTTGMYEDSDYNKWLTKMGIDALTAKSAATGNLRSGNLGTALVNFAQNQAGAGFADWYNRNVSEDTTLYNRLMGIVNPAQTATATVGNAGVATAANIASTLANANQLQNMYASQGIAALGGSSGQIGNQIMQGINAYNRNNAMYDQQMYSGGDMWSGSDIYGGSNMTGSFDTGGGWAMA